MIIGTVKFPGLVGNDKRKQNKYLSQLKKNAVILCKQYSRGSNRYIADLNKRLNLIKDYINQQGNNTTVENVINNIEEAQPLINNNEALSEERPHME